MVMRSLASLLPLSLAAIALIPADAFSVVVSRRQALLSSAGVAVPFAPLLNINANAVSDLSGFQDGPRGLKYQVVTPSTDPGSATPERAQKVEAQYTLWLDGFGEDGGKQIDSSRGPLGGRPFAFNAGVSQVIKGWDLAVLDMRAGERRRLAVPSELGYGDKGAGGRIPGGATLYFDLELVGIGERKELRPEQVQWLEDNPV